MITKEACFGMYIGQKITDRDNDIPITKLKGIKNVDNILYCQFFEDGEFKSRYLSDCKLILRPFESMTGEEKGKVVNMIGADHIREINNLLEYYDGSEDDLIIKLYCAYMPSIVEHLISIGIDVFNLRERGWAVYESDLKGENNENN